VTPEEPETPKNVVTFDEMPATSVLSISSPGITAEGIVGTNTWEIATVGEVKALYIKKEATGVNAEGTLLNYTCGVALTAPIDKSVSDANVAIFEADIMISSLDAADHIQITANSTSASPFLGLFIPIASEDTFVIRNESFGAEKTVSSAKLGEWFHLRVEYRITESDDAGKPTAFELTYIINEDEPVISTSVREGKTIFSLDELKTVSMSFNRKFKGEFYVDNVSCYLEYIEDAAI